LNGVDGSLGGLVYKIRTDGMQRTGLSDDVCLEINVADGWIYYIKCRKLSAKLLRFEYK